MYYCSNLHHNVITSRCLTRAIHFNNKTLADWCSKEKAMIKTTTFLSKLSFTCACVEKFIDLRVTLRYLGAPLRERSFRLSYNKSSVWSRPQRRILEGYVALSFYRSRETITASIFCYRFIGGSLMLAEMLGNYWSRCKAQCMWKPLMF